MSNFYTANTTFRILGYGWKPRIKLTFIVRLSLCLYPYGKYSILKSYWQYNMTPFKIKIESLLMELKYV